MAVMDLNEDQAKETAGMITPAGDQAIAVRPIPDAVGKPEDLAAVICFPAAPEAALVTGTTLVMDGGRLCCL